MTGTARNRVFCVNAAEMRLPDAGLAATDGSTVNLARLNGLTVCFIYPYTGRPGVADPVGWDDIPGAHGSTPQAKAYASLHRSFSELGARVFGISLQDTAWQQEFVARAGLPFPLLSDRERVLTNGLALETFNAGDRSFLRRRALVLRDGTVVFDKTYYAKPDEDAAEILSWIRKHAG